MSRDTSILSNQYQTCNFISEIIRVGVFPVDTRVLRQAYNLSVHFSKRVIYVKTNAL